MDKLTLVLAFVSTVLSSCVSLIYAYTAYKKSKEPPKDEIWETTVKILCNANIREINADDFALLYESLKLFKDNSCTKDGILSLECAIRDKSTYKPECK